MAKTFKGAKGNKTKLAKATLRIMVMKKMTKADKLRAEPVILMDKKAVEFKTKIELFAEKKKLDDALRNAFKARTSKGVVANMMLAKDAMRVLEHQAFIKSQEVKFHKRGGWPGPRRGGKRT